VLADPRRMLGRLCGALGVEFSESMLSWPAGRRPTDGIWAKYWYAAVENSTGFDPYRPKQEEVPLNLQPLLDECLGCYESLYAQRLGR
jgi:sulfotransferase family protein